jgi:hypothetical protein
MVGLLPLLRRVVISVTGFMCLTQAWSPLLLAGCNQASTHQSINKW